MERFRIVPGQILSLMKEHLNISYLDVEESLTNISGIANSASLQLNIRSSESQVPSSHWRGVIP